VYYRADGLNPFAIDSAIMQSLLRCSNSEQPPVLRKKFPGGIRLILGNVAANPNENHMNDKKLPGASRQCTFDVSSRPDKVAGHEACAGATASWTAAARRRPGDNRFRLEESARGLPHSKAWRRRDGSWGAATLKCERTLQP
jgi:hypothetical protein